MTPRAGRRRAVSPECPQRARDQRARWCAVLHDRRIPGRRSNIDHVVVCPSGVFVVDAKQYRGRPRLRVQGAILRPRTETLMVGHRHCNNLVDAVIRQLELVRAVLGDEGEVPMQLTCRCRLNSLAGDSRTCRFADHYPDDMFGTEATILVQTLAGQPRVSTAKRHTLTISSHTKEP